MSLPTNPFRIPMSAYITDKDGYLYEYMGTELKGGKLVLVFKSARAYTTRRRGGTDTHFWVRSANPETLIRKFPYLAELRR